MKINGEGPFDGIKQNKKGRKMEQRNPKTNLFKVCISSTTDKEMCFVSGWGATSVTKGPKGEDIFGYQDKLQFLAISVITRSACDKLSDYKTSDHEFCAQGNGIKKGACLVSFLLAFI